MTMVPPVRLADRVVMSFPTAVLERRPNSTGSSPLAETVTAIAGGVAVVVLLLAGLTFVGLAIAFPIALPIAERYHIAVSAADAALARQFTQFAWVFGGLAVASFTAAAAIVLKGLTGRSDYHGEDA